jgi:hypothetical protein
MGPDPAIFVIVLQDANKKTNFFKQVFLLITVLFEGTFTSFFKGTVKSFLKRQKTVGIKVFLTIFA